MAYLGEGSFGVVRTDGQFAVKRINPYVATGDVSALRIAPLLNIQTTDSPEDQQIKQIFLQVYDARVTLKSATQKKGKKYPFIYI